MAPWQQRAWLALGVVSLVGGWLAPQYAAKLWGSELNRFLQDSPVSAGVLVECFWILLFIPIALGRRREEVSVAPARCEGFCGQAGRAGWLLALQLAGLVALVHVAWFASFSKTNVATNTLLWNTDTLTTPLAALIIARERPTSGAMLGGLVGLAGAALSVGASAAGDTLLGCGLVVAASFGYALNSVVVEKVRDPRQVSVLMLLALEGVVTVLALALSALAASALRPEVIRQWVMALPPTSWLVFLGLSSLLLNVGWLWCAELAGSFWTAMVACSTIPITLVLDVVLMGTHPTPASLLGSLLVVAGFVIASWPGAAAAAQPEPEAAGRMGDCCQRWHGWTQARAAPLLPPRSPGSASTSTGAGADDAEAGTSDDALSCSSRGARTASDGSEAAPTPAVAPLEEV